MTRALLLLILSSPLQGQPDRFGMPACLAAREELATRTAFVLCHSSEHKVATWAAHELRPQYLAAMAVPRLKHFRRDWRVTGSASDSDYRLSGYQRGHVVPAADVAWSAAAMADSFLLSNAAPQLPEINGGSMRRVENAIRKLAVENDAVYVITGNLFDCALTHIGPNQVAVPCATYKVVLAVQGASKQMYAAIVPCDQPVTVRELEQRTGLDFFDALPRAEQELLEPTSRPLM